TGGGVECVERPVAPADDNVRAVEYGGIPERGARWKRPLRSPTCGVQAIHLSISAREENAMLVGGTRVEDRPAGLIRPPVLAGLRVECVHDSARRADVGGAAGYDGLDARPAPLGRGGAPPLPLERG